MNARRDAGPPTPQYDAVGNMTSGAVGSNNTGVTYKYDAWGRLVFVRGTGQYYDWLDEFYRYDGLGRRVRNISNDCTNEDNEVTEFYHSASWQVLETRLDWNVPRNSGTEIRGHHT